MNENQPITSGYEMGSVMKASEFRKLKNGDVIHHIIYDENGKNISNEFDFVDTSEIKNYGFEVKTINNYTFYINSSVNENKNIKNQLGEKNSKFTINKVVTIDSVANNEYFESFLKNLFEGKFEPKEEPKRLCNENIDEIVNEIYKESKGYEWLDSDD